MIVATATSPEFSIQTLTGFGTQLLDWIITTINTVLTWMLANPVVFIGLILSLIIAAIGILRHLIGGRKADDVVTE